MRSIRNAVGAALAAGALLLGLSATPAHAAAAPRPAAATVASTSVYINTYSYPQCLSWAQYYNSIGYISYCVIRGSLGDLYVVV